MSETRHLGGAQRILVYGVTGSGKTTVASQISEATGIAWTDVDALTWEPAWTQVSAEEQRRRIGPICAGESWILDTAYASWRDVVLERAEVIVALDYPRWVSLRRLLRRTLVRLVTREEVCNGNVESWRQVFSRDSILLWHFRSFANKRTRIAEWAASSSGPPVLRLRSPRETSACLEDLRAGSERAH